MKKRKITASELILNSDGTIFHLHLLPEHLSDIVILVGDPGRVETVAANFETREVSIQNREFQTVTGLYNGVRMTVISTGIGTDNIDIVLTELDALANIDFSTREVKDEFRQLTLLRLGSSGALQEDIKIGDFVFARYSVGFDGLLNFYKGRDQVSELDMEKEFTKFVGWDEKLAAPYFVESSPQIWELFKDSVTEGVTISAPGFYAPQGRWLRLEPADILLNQKIEIFRYNTLRITNFEMESSALAGLSKLMGHRAATLCAIIAQRVAQDANTEYKDFMQDMIKISLDKLSKIK